MIKDFEQIIQWSPPCKSIPGYLVLLPSGNQCCQLPIHLHSSRIFYAYMSKQANISPSFFYINKLLDTLFSTLLFSIHPGECSLFPHFYMAA